MEIPKTGKHTEYARYAWHCLKMVEIAPDRKSRSIQREMAAEWLKLADQAAMEDVVVGAEANGKTNGQSKAASEMPPPLASSLFDWAVRR